MKDSKVIVKLRIPRGARTDDSVLPGRRRILFVLLAAVMVVLLVAGHVAYWYLPRLRAAQPGRGLPAQLLAGSELPFAVWMPFPHQNLALLERAMASSEAGEAGDFSAALARLVGVAEPKLPAFGTFRVPPSSEITFASDETGERFAVAAEVYPAVAAFAKLAGRLANNLWLSGGELTVEGRSVEVAWYGRVWTVSSPGLPKLAPAADSPPGPPSLLVAEARNADPPVPPGRFHLILEGGDLVLRSAGASSVKSFDLPDLAELGLFLLLVSGGDSEEQEPIQAMAFFHRDNPLTFSQEGVSYEFPGMASIWETGVGKHWDLPGESVLEWSGRKARRTHVGPLSVSAIDRRSFHRMQKLVPRLMPMVQPSPEGRLVRGLWLDLEAGHLEISRIARALEEIPIVARRHRQRWRDTATVLAPVARSYSRLSVVVTEEPEALELRFTQRP